MVEIPKKAAIHPKTILLILPGSHDDCWWRLKEFVFEQVGEKRQPTVPLSVIDAEAANVCVDGEGSAATMWCS